MQTIKKNNYAFKDKEKSRKISYASTIFKRFVRDNRNGPC